MLDVSFREGRRTFFFQNIIPLLICFSSTQTSLIHCLLVKNYLSECFFFIYRIELLSSCKIIPPLYLKSDCCWSLIGKKLSGYLMDRLICTCCLLFEVEPAPTNKNQTHLWKYFPGVALFFDHFSILQEWAQRVIIYFKIAGVAFMPQIWGRSHLWGFCTLRPLLQPEDALTCCIHSDDEKPGPTFPDPTALSY